MSTTLGIHAELERSRRCWNDASDRRDAGAFVALSAADAWFMLPGSTGPRRAARRSSAARERASVGDCPRRCEEHPNE
jgi:hypothetical protein